ncbi:MAG: single-stranded DNA-binding protein [Bacteroidia bacterium]|jgi:single-strand DNA-binding protein|nr:single-stranded DNA-binding protein [Bacteroidia bacterium]
MSLNKVMLIGNVGRDPEIRDLPNDVKVARFPLATSEKFRSKNNGEVNEQTEWHNIVCWRSLANLAENYIKKGSRLYIEGRIRTSSWLDKTTQEKRYSTEIQADSIVLLDRAPSTDNRELTQQPNQISNQTNTDDTNSDDLPF